LRLEGESPVAIWPQKTLPHFSRFPERGFAMKEIPHTSFRRAGRWMAVCLALSFALAPGFTRAQTGKAPQPAEPAPRIQFESLEVDLGSIAEGVNPPFKFAFRNEGNADLVIKQVQKTCGCTHAESTKSTLKPGESAEITGEFNTIGRLGKQSKTITVLSNDPKEPSVTLRFVADVKQWIRVEPQFLTFGDVGIGETVTRPITINNQTGSPLRIKGIKSESPLVTARVISPVSETARRAARRKACPWRMRKRPSRSRRRSRPARNWSTCTANS
jgi:hypothetical protein